MTLKDDLISLAVGDHPQSTVWLKKGPLNVPEYYLEHFKALGISSRAWQGNVFVLRSIKVFRPFDEITEHHMRIIETLNDSDMYAEKPDPSTESESPFPVWRVGTGGGYGNGRSRNSSVAPVETTVADVKPTPEPEPVVEEVPEEEEEIFSLFD